jgi:hypothetical protein
LVLDCNRELIRTGYSEAQLVFRGFADFDELPRQMKARRGGNFDFGVRTDAQTLG